MHCHITLPLTPSPCPPTFPLDMFARSQFIYIITLHFICGTYRHADVHVYIKGTLRHVSYFHCRHVHYAIPAVTELYRHSIVLRYCRYMHLQYNTHFSPLLLYATLPPLFLHPLNHPSPPLPSPSLPPSPPLLLWYVHSWHCCTPWQVGGRGCEQNSKNSYSVWSIPTVHVQLMYSTPVAGAVVGLLHTHHVAGGWGWMCAVQRK